MGGGIPKTADYPSRSRQQSNSRELRAAILKAKAAAATAKADALRDFAELRRKTTKSPAELRFSPPPVPASKNEPSDSAGSSSGRNSGRNFSRNSSSALVETERSLAPWKKQVVTWKVPDSNSSPNIVDERIEVNPDHMIARLVLAKSVGLMRSLLSPTPPSRTVPTSTEVVRDSDLGNYRRDTYLSNNYYNGRVSVEVHTYEDDSESYIALYENEGRTFLNQISENTGVDIELIHYHNPALQNTYQIVGQQTVVLDAIHVLAPEEKDSEEEKADSSPSPVPIPSPFAPAPLVALPDSSAATAALYAPVSPFSAAPSNQRLQGEAAQPSQGAEEQRDALDKEANKPAPTTVRGVSPLPHMYSQDSAKEGHPSLSIAQPGSSVESGFAKALSEYDQAESSVEDARLQLNELKEFEALLPLNPTERPQELASAEAEVKRAEIHANRERIELELARVKVDAQKAGTAVQEFDDLIGFDGSPDKLDREEFEMRARLRAELDEAEEAVNVFGNLGLEIASRAEQAGISPELYQGVMLASPTEQELDGMSVFEFADKVAQRGEPVPINF